jgi:hypothetical protein
MSRFMKAALALAAGTIGVVGMQAAPALASTTTANSALLVGRLGYEGGAPPGGLHPTSGTVEVEFANPPLALEQSVGSNGRFRISLPAGKYTVTGCGPSSSGGSSQCSKPKNITLKAGEVDHIKLVWAYVP